VEQHGPRIVISLTKLKSLVLSEYVSLSESCHCVQGRMMTGWFNAALAKIKGLSDKYQGRLRDCFEKSF
jgi:hypothetical protein